MADAYKPAMVPEVPLATITIPSWLRSRRLSARCFLRAQAPEIGSNLRSGPHLVPVPKVWLAIPTDGRQLPLDPEPRWYGYSVGHWEDDYTFVVDTVGLDERTWLDNAGDPHSADMRVEETYHRTDLDTLELTVKIDDPKAYTMPWIGLDKFVLHREPRTFDIGEMFCVPLNQEYKKTVAEPAAE